MAVSFRHVLPACVAFVLATACSDIQSVKYPIRERDGSVVKVTKPYQSAFSGDPGDRSFKLIQEGKIDQALSVIRSASESAPSNAGWHYDTAIIFEIQGRWADALEEIKFALRIFPNDSRYREEQAFIVRHMPR